MIISLKIQCQQLTRLCRLNVQDLFISDTSSWPSSISTGLGPMEPDQALKKKAGDEQDTLPRQSLECLEYLKNVQRFQLKMIAKRVNGYFNILPASKLFTIFIQMNKFCKYALSELLRLKLGDCPIEKRLVPMVDYLDRHRMALQKYVYPDCFSAIMKFMWECLLQASQIEYTRAPLCDHTYHAGHNTGGYNNNVVQWIAVILQHEIQNIKPKFT